MLCLIDIYSKYPWVIPLKDKKRITITNAFQKVLKESKKKTNKIWVDKGSKFYNRSMEPWFEKNGIKMYSTHNKGKPVVSEWFITTLKNKIYKYLTSVSKNDYINKLDDIINKYNNTYHGIIKMKPADVNQTHILNLVKKLMIKIQNLKLVIPLEFRNIKVFFENVTN